MNPTQPAQASFLLLPSPPLVHARSRGQRHGGIQRRTMEIRWRWSWIRRFRLLLDPTIWAKVAEVERADQEAAAEDQYMMMPPPVGVGATTELQALPASFDPRGYYLQAQASMLAAASAVSSSSQQHPQGQEHHHLQTALHLRYHIKVDSSVVSKGFI